jgi:hypothetical protein
MQPSYQRHHTSTLHYVHAPSISVTAPNSLETIFTFVSINSSFWFDVTLNKILLMAELQSVLERRWKPLYTYGVQSERVQSAICTGSVTEVHECHVSASDLWIGAAGRSAATLFARTLSLSLGVCAPEIANPQSTTCGHVIHSGGRTTKTLVGLHSLARFWSCMTHSTTRWIAYNMHVHSRSTWYEIFPIALTIEVELEWVFRVGRIIAMRNVQANKGCFVALRIQWHNGNVTRLSEI